MFKCCSVCEALRFGKGKSEGHSRTAESGFLEHSVDDAIHKRVLSSPSQLRTKLKTTCTQSMILFGTVDRIQHNCSLTSSGYMSFDFCGESDSLQSQMQRFQLSTNVFDPSWCDWRAVLRASSPEGLRAATQTCPRLRSQPDSC
jgi:hypothetical protein